LLADSMQIGVQDWCRFGADWCMLDLVGVDVCTGLLEGVQP
jgi:hypothetical protein